MLRLEAAGYAVAGKTNLHEFAYGISSQNPHFGTVPNPGRPAGSPAARAAARRLRSPRGTSSSRSARTPAARSGSRRRGAGSSASSRRSTSSPPTAAGRSRRATTTSGRWRRRVDGCVELMRALVPGFAPAATRVARGARGRRRVARRRRPARPLRASRRPRRISRAGASSTSRSPPTTTGSSCARSPTSTAASSRTTPTLRRQRARKDRAVPPVTDGEVEAARRARAEYRRAGGDGARRCRSPRDADGRFRRSAERRGRADDPRARDPLHLPVRLPRLARARDPVRRRRGRIPGLDPARGRRGDDSRVLAAGGRLASLVRGRAAG